MYYSTFIAVGILVVGAEPKGDDKSTPNELLGTLPGRTAFALFELTERGPEVVQAANEKERFPVGSSFKLYILGTLADDLNAGLRRAEDVMLLRKDLIGPPGSEMAAWPIGSPVTLHTLALKMISISDNTATDHLLYLLGRENVEAHLGLMGHGEPSVNIPLLSTREMVLLRDKANGTPGKKYREMSVPERRQYLDEYCRGPVDYEKVDFDAASYDLAEWYASPMDMSHALDWLRRHGEEGMPGHVAREILAVDPKLPRNVNVWPYIGFKGGSEDQIIAGNWLLRHKNGRWYTLHIYCSSEKEKLDPEKFLKVAEGIFASVTAKLRDGNQ